MTIRIRLALVGSIAVTAGTASADPAPFCSGDYAEDLSALSPHARDAEAHAASYSYAVRTTATYECVSYGGDGNLKKARTVATAYGTAFGYRRDGNDTLLITNTHVAEWPAVTDDDHPVDGIAAGCKRVADSLAIVDDDHDDYAADDIPLARVVSDPALDVSILRAHSKLEILPWRIGRSAALVARDAVEVKGFPLGEFQATNVGKVISAYDHDDQGERNHDDFVVDALLSQGGSGSPVLAVSCKTGEFELVGIFHARYQAASALNVVVAIDQVRELMTTLKRSPRPAPELASELDAASRARIADSVAHDLDPSFFALGPLTASVRPRADGALVFAVFGPDFPRNSQPLLVLEDLRSDDAKAFGKLGAVYVGGVAGLQVWAANDADADSQATLARLLASVRAAALATIDYRQSAQTAAASRDAFQRIAKQRRALDRAIDGQRETAAQLVDFAARTSAHTTGAPVRLVEIQTAIARPAPVAVK